MKGIIEFISSVAASEPLPGGGSAGALAGALAAALGEMMAGVTEDKAKFAAIRPRLLEIHAKMARLRDVLQSLVQEDAEAYRSLLNAVRLPRETEAQRFIRSDVIEKSLKNATETPLRTARAAFEVLEYLKILIEIGNPNAKSDVAAGAQLAYASIKGGQYNVLANIRGLKDRSYAESCRTEITGFVTGGRRILEQIDNQITGL